VTASQLIEKEIAAQKKIISRLKAEVFGLDKTGRISYIRDFHSEFNNYRRIISLDRILSRAAQRDVVYFGDFHPLPASQEHLITLMKALAARERKIVLAMEMLYEHQQVYLDLWMKGTISEEEFLGKIEYSSEWGFDWRSYRPIFELCKDPFIPIFGIDSEPRDNLKMIRTRDRMIAHRLANIRRFFPGYVLVVFIGESHLASTHLPAEVRRADGGDFSEMTIVHNIEEIYWSLLRRGKSGARAVQVDTTKYCIFTTSPIIKYQYYRTIMDIWTGDQPGDRWTPVLAEWVENILRFLPGDFRKIKVTVEGDWKEDILAVFPETIARKTYIAFASFLRSQKIDAPGITMSSEMLKNCGIYYSPTINDFLILRFDPLYAAGEAARFVVFALRDRIGRLGKQEKADDDRFYAFVFEEALVYFGSKLINPTRDFVQTDMLLQRIDPHGAVCEALPRKSLADTREIAALFKYHIRRERCSRGALRLTRKLRKIHKLGITKRLLIVKALGATLGEAIYRGIHEGHISREELLELYREPFDEPGKARATYMEWVRRTESFNSLHFLTN
jgi:hypothetical protein